MTELRRVLERGIGPYEPTDGAFERTVRRATKHQRNRRLGAAALAIVIASVGMGLAGFAFLGRSVGPAATLPPVLPTTVATRSAAAPTTDVIGLRLIAPYGGLASGQPGTPVATFTYGGNETLVPVGHHIDGMGQREVSDLLILLRAEPGALLQLTGNAARMTATYRPYLRGHDLVGTPVPIELRNGIGRLPATPGAYRIHIVGYWPAGHAGFLFDIAVIAP
jgi:hypothetical protein